MGIVTSCERSEISLPSQHSQHIACSNKTNPVFKLLGEQVVTLDSAVNITDTDYFLQNPYDEDAGRDYLAHLIPDDTDLATLPPDRFPVPAGLELPSEYPLWLGSYINKKGGMRLRLVVSSMSMSANYLEKVSEANHLRDNLHYLSFTYTHNADEARPRFLLWEVHKGRREHCLTVRKRRYLYPRIVLMKKTETFIIIGKGFMLRLFPLPEGADPDRYGPQQNNGELPVSLGTYTRILDTAPTMSMDWDVRLWAWENSHQT
ncbi:uncharacterized protein LOC110447050 [Mizuhopecten yessoensis]|uniref:uncharacterized protein LOC110447050 n=1 Tax=Mizuhopecten yessoensis TaxID=6573 RepID=UPI000B45BA83|nr:uncharacterized protein LOC110447050 [Mizuhopecten yessoensis]